MNLDDRSFHLSLTSDALLRISLEGTEALTVEVPANEMVLQRVYVTAPVGSEAAAVAHTELTLWVEDLASTDRAYKDTVFNGKGE
jgi:hypothetical protein